MTCAPRIRRAAMAVALAVAVLPPAPAHADPPTRGEQWTTIAQDALAGFHSAEGSVALRPFALAYAAQATAWLNGWADQQALAYLDEVYAQENPDGGYGLGVAFDAFGDGTVNPATTTYTVTLASHVGPVLLDGYRAGVVPRAKVQKVIDLIVSTPRMDTAAGRCVAYSRSANDVQVGYCVHNVNAGAAAFLLDAGESGFSIAWWLVGGITQRETAAFKASTAWWPYRDGAVGLNDTDHNAYTAEAMYHLAYPVGYAATFNHLVRELPDNAQAPLAHLRLTGLPATASSADWCAMGDQWLPEAAAFVAASAENTGRLAQAAYFAARNALTCD